jgi:hypothetical protein
VAQGAARRVAWSRGRFLEIGRGFPFSGPRGELRLLTAAAKREENVLIRVTEEAKVLLSTVDLGTLDSAEGTVLRLDPVAYDEVAGAMRLSFAPGEGKGNDQIVQHGDKQVLRIAGVVSQRLNGSTMDVVVEEGPEGSRSMGIGIMPPGPEPLADDS